MENANIEQRIIGTWKYLTGEENTWVFKTNGTLTKSGHEAGNYRFVVADTKLATVKEGSWGDICNILMSSDGKTLIVNQPGKNNCLWLTKQ